MGESGVIEYCIETDEGLVLKLGYMTGAGMRNPANADTFSRQTTKKFVMLDSARYRSLKSCQK